jgi:uncharacterized protein
MNEATSETHTLAGLAALKADNHAEGLGRLEAIQQAMDPDWRASTQARVHALTHAAASPRTKLPKLYALVNEFSEVRDPHVSCKAGCSACCRRIPVEITDLEARHISQVTGIPMATLPPGRHIGKDFINQPCTFLVDDRCSIYEHRPYHCRSLASVDRDALTCTDLNIDLTIQKDPRAVAVVMSKAEHLDPLYQHIVGGNRVVRADIRSFFPPGVARKQA